MPRRQVKDEHGSVWDVWDVKPGDAIGRAAYDRRNAARAAGEADANSAPDRADLPSIPAASEAPETPMLSAELEHGWLCFQTGSERRRFAPIPPNWAELPDGVLRVMLEVASPVMTPAQGTRPSGAPDPRSPAAE